MAKRIRQIITEKLRVDFWDDERSGLLTRRLDKVMDLQATPYAVADELIDHFRVM